MNCNNMDLQYIYAFFKKELQVKGCYGYGYNETAEGPKQAFQMALEMIGDNKIQVEDMLTHKFPLKDYRKMIEVNMNKTANRAIKTAVTFE